jgi:hypothetical protein
VPDYAPITEFVGVPDYARARRLRNSWGSPITPRPITIHKYTIETLKQGYISELTAADELLARLYASTGARSAA